MLEAGSIFHSISLVLFFFLVPLAGDLDLGGGATTIITNRAPFSSIDQSRTIVILLVFYRYYFK